MPPFLSLPSCRKNAGTEKTARKPVFSIVAGVFELMAVRVLLGKVTRSSPYGLPDDMTFAERKEAFTLLLKGRPGMTQQKAMEVAGLSRGLHTGVWNTVHAWDRASRSLCVCDNAAAILILK